MKVGRVYTFHAAHHLPGHKGKCARPHGHSYKVEVEVDGQMRFEEGASDDRMVIDFDDLDAIVEPIIDLLDHTDLNESAPQLIGIKRTTAEALAVGLHEAIQSSLDAVRPGRTHEVLRVRVWETDRNYAEA